EILEGYREQMRTLQTAKAVGRDGGTSLIPDACQIGVNIDHRDSKGGQTLSEQGLAFPPRVAGQTYTGNSSCDQPAGSEWVAALGSAARSSTSFSRISRLPGGFERRARSAFATRRIARVSSRFDW